MQLGVQHAARKPRLDSHDVKSKDVRLSTTSTFGLRRHSHNCDLLKEDTQHWNYFLCLSVTWDRRQSRLNPPGINLQESETDL